MTWGTASAKSLPPGGPCRLLSTVLFLTPHLFGGLESALVIDLKGGYLLEVKVNGKTYCHGTGFPDDSGVDSIMEQQGPHASR